MLEGLDHRNGDALGEQLKLDDFGGDFHAGSMCKRAQKSSDTVCALAESMLADLRAQHSGMATRPKSEAVQHYRDQIRLYLTTVQVAKGWKLAQMGKAAGGLVHTTIGRALKGEHTMQLPALLAIEEASEVKIPETLFQAARQAAQPQRNDPYLERQISEMAQQLMDRPPEEREAIIEQLRKSAALT